MVNGFTITSPATAEYNCIAWAAEDTSACWWPDPSYIYFWPPNLPREETVETFMRAYETLGYIYCDSADYEDGFEKIAIFIHSDGKPKHAAKQLTSGSWTSKLGQAEDIEHALDGVAGSIYGRVAAIMKRPIYR